MMYTDFEKAFHAEYPDTAFAEKVMGKEKVLNILHRAHAVWEEGTRWVFESPMEEFLGCDEKRNPENEEVELKACLRKTAENMVAEAKTAYIQTLPREEVIEMLNGVVIDQNNIDGMVKTEIGEVYYLTMMEIWNKGNEGNEIRYTPDYSI